MKRIFSLFIVFIVFINFCFVNALDERSILTSVEATSNIDTIISYAGTLVNPTFNITIGSEAHFVIENSGWYWYNGERWLHRTNGYKFNSGKWDYRIELRLDGEASETLRLANTTTIKINGENWTFSYKGIDSETNYSYGIAISPSYDLEPSGELYFFDNEDCRIYSSYNGNAIPPHTLSSLVEGGTAPYVFSKVSGPSWINVSEDGVISGTPTEVGNNDNLVVRVTDAESNYKEITYYVDKTILSPGLRELIENITATSNTSSIPVIGNEIVNPTFNITNVEGAFFAGYAGKWYKKIGDNWKVQTGEFTPGVWQYKTEVILEGEPAETHRLSDDTVVIVDDEDWNAGLSGIGNEYYALSVNSKEYTIKGKINSIVLDGTINPPKIGEDIVEPIIWATLVNGENDLTSLIDVTASWEYKTGDNFFDWEEASGKFEAGKTYHIRFMISVEGEIYELENIAVFPVTLNDYELIQFQLNNKTVGEYIEFNIIEPIKVPEVKIKNDNNKITLTWSSQTEAVKYKVYRSTDGKKFTKLSDVKENSFTEKGLTYGKKYYYKVKSCDSIKCTTYSNVVSKKIKPNKVSNLTVKSAGSNNIKLSWDKVSVTGYEVYRSTDNKKWSKVITITKNSTLKYNVKKLKSNKKYYFKVRAYKTVSGKKYYGSYSSVVSTKTAPEKPTVKLTIKDVESMNLIISASKGATKYVIGKSLDDKTYETLEDLTEAGTLVQTEQEAGITYYFRVKACNIENRCSGWTKVSLKQTTKTPKLTLTTTKKKVTATISPVSGAEGYRLYMATSKNGKYTMVKEFTIADEVLEYISKTTTGKTYYYKVRAFTFDDAGKKVYSPYSSIKYIKSK